MDVPHVTHEMWMTCLWYVQKLRRRLQPGDKMLVGTVEPSDIQGPPGSSLLWSSAHAKVL